MNRAITILSSVFILIFAAIYFAADYLNFDLYDFYSKKLQTPFFTGFLTLGGFLLSLKTFILIKLKEDLYSRQSYRDRFETRRQLNPNLTLYGPLSRLGTFLVYCVLFALLSSFSQLSLGFIPSPAAAASCISVAVVTVLIVLRAWWEIKINLSTWFDLLEEEEKNRQ